MTTNHINHINRYNNHDHREPAHWRMTRCGSQRLLAAIAKAHPERIIITQVSK